MYGNELLKNKVSAKLTEHLGRYAALCHVMFSATANALDFFLMIF